VTIPALLQDCTGDKTKFMIEAATLSEALTKMKQSYPLLRFHLFTEDEQLREHVLIFYNEKSIAWLDDLHIPLQQGDKITVMQAVSGG
jgi:sulfur-carrier protein